MEITLLWFIIAGPAKHYAVPILTDCVREANTSTEKVRCDACTATLTPVGIK